MIGGAQRTRRVASATLLAALVGCGPAPGPNNAASPSTPSTNAAAITAPQGPDTAIAPLMPDPDHDDRPDRVKTDDFAGHLQRIQANMTAVDTEFLARVRTAMQAGSQADAKQVLADYRTLIAADIAALPGAPRLGGCFARAAAPNATAEAAVAAMLSDRRDKADTVAGIVDRPLSLPDFGGLATDIATGAGADAARSGVTAAQASVAGCRDAPIATAHHQGSPQAPLAGGAAPPSPVSPPPPAPAPAQQPPTKKPGFFQRMFGG